MKSNSIIIDFIGDDYIEYSDFWENTYQNLSIYDYYLLHYLIPDKESLKKYVLNKMENITDDVIDNIFNKIEELKNKQEN